MKFRDFFPFAPLAVFERVPHLLLDSCEREIEVRVSGSLRRETRLEGVESGLVAGTMANSVAPQVVCMHLRV